MGDPRKTRKKYETPEHPWIASRIEEEKILSHKFGTKNKKELYKMDSVLKRFKNQAKALVSRTDRQAVIEREQMTNRMVSLGLVNPGATLDDILSLSITDVMNRRLQTVLVKRLLARSTKQARQLIVHGHVLVGKNVVTSPSYLVRIDEDSQITFRANSPFVNEQHPERFSEEELKKQRDNAAAKAASKAPVEEEEAPPTFDEKDIQDPETMTKITPEAPKKATKKVAKKVTKSKKKTEEKPEAKDTPVNLSEEAKDTPEVVSEKKPAATSVVPEKKDEAKETPKPEESVETKKPAEDAEVKE